MHERNSGTAAAWSWCCVNWCGTSGDHGGHAVRTGARVAQIAGHGGAALHLGRSDQFGRLGELRQRLLFVIGALFVYRVGAHIPIPGIDPRALASMFADKGGILDMVNMFSGGSLKRLSIFALGIMPYISASIILQLMAGVIPQLEQIKKEGESGRKKINQWTRYATVFLASFQAVGIGMALQGQSAGGAPVVINPGFQFVFVCAVSLVCGTVFLMWLGEQIAERGIGNGTSLIIFSGSIAGLPNGLFNSLSLMKQGGRGGCQSDCLFRSTGL